MDGFYTNLLHDRWLFDNNQCCEVQTEFLDYFCFFYNIHKVHVEFLTKVLLVGYNFVFVFFHQSDIFIICWTLVFQEKLYELPEQFICCDIASCNIVKMALIVFLPILFVVRHSFQINSSVCKRIHFPL